jgi:hypothetical protein
MNLFWKETIEIFYFQNVILFNFFLSYFKLLKIFET